MAYTQNQLNQLGKYTQSMTDQMNNSNNAYNATQRNIAQMNAAQQNDKALRESRALRTLEGNNATAYSQYQKTINPYTQNQNASSGTSDYLKNSAYGTFLGGIGRNQQTYNDSLQNSNSLWLSWLGQKAGQQAQAENDKQAYDDNWYQYYMGQKRADDEAEAQKAREAEAKRQFDLELSLKNQQLAEEKRQFDAQVSARTSGGSGGYSGGGGGNTVGTTQVVDGVQYRWDGTKWATVNGYTKGNANSNVFGNTADQTKEKAQSYGTKTYGMNLGVGQTKSNRVSAGQTRRVWNGTKYVNQVYRNGKWVTA